MKSYFIFAIVLTVVYLIYYAVIIVQDLYGKRGTEKTDEEVFDLGAPDDEESVTVTESETGFSVGGEQYETESETTAPSAEPETETEKKDKETEESAEEKLERLKAKAEEQMEDTIPYLSDARTADEMYKAMLAKGRLENRPDMAWKPIKDRL